MVCQSYVWTGKTCGKESTTTTAYHHPIGTVNMRVCEDHKVVKEVKHDKLP